LIVCGAYKWSIVRCKAIARRMPRGSDPSREGSITISKSFAVVIGALDVAIARRCRCRSRDGIVGRLWHRLVETIARAQKQALNKS
jgi:hypothetical protein